MTCEHNYKHLETLRITYRIKNCIPHTTCYDYFYDHIRIDRFYCTKCLLQKEHLEIKQDKNAIFPGDF